MKKVDIKYLYIVGAIFAIAIFLSLFVITISTSTTTPTPYDTGMEVSAGEAPIQTMPAQPMPTQMEIVPTEEVPVVEEEPRVAVGAIIQPVKPSVVTKVEAAPAAPMVKAIPQKEIQIPETKKVISQPIISQPIGPIMRSNLPTKVNPALLKNPKNIGNTNMPKVMSKSAEGLTQGLA